MGIIKFLESIRNPVLDYFFLLITQLGEETVFIIVGFFLFWCVNKKHGYYVLFVGFLGTVLNQVLKLAFRVPRPWVRDNSFTIVEKAKEAAVGYSFPSGHTQVAVGVFGSISTFLKTRGFKIICWIVCILIPLSRMYLGVHTFADVITSFLIAIVLIFVMKPIVERAFCNERYMNLLLGVFTLVALSFVLYTRLFPFPEEIDRHNYLSGVSISYKLLGCMVGLWISYFVDMHFIKFDTKATIIAQVMKLVLGSAFVMGVKYILRSLIGTSDISQAITYFSMTFAACGVWPVTFKYFARVGK